MKKSTSTATRKVKVTICVQLSERGQRNEIKNGRSGKPTVLVKGRISPEDVDLFKVDAEQACRLGCSLFPPLYELHDFPLLLGL